MSRGIYLIFTVLIASCHWSPVSAINHGVVDGGAGGGGGGGTDENGAGAALFKLRSKRERSQTVVGKQEFKFQLISSRFDYALG